MEETLAKRIGMSKDVINKAAALAMKAQENSPDKPFTLDKAWAASHAIFAFAGSWLPEDWFAKSPFGETNMDISTFRSLRSIGIDEVAKVNEAFLKQFNDILSKSSLVKKVEKIIAKKPVVFTGHSSGGAMAVLATLFFLEKSTTPSQNQRLRCVTFGSPLVGNRIFSHALRREKWSDHFVHFVLRYDIIPRIMLGPSSTETQQILDYFNPRCERKHIDPSLDYYATVMRSTSMVANRAACNLKECTNPLLENATNFIELSPYRPFGTYIFCTGNGTLVVARNPDAVLQILFYSGQLSNAEELREVANKSLRDHLGYKEELQESLEMLDVVDLDKLDTLPFTSDGSSATVNKALNDLGLGTQARLCLRAAGESENRKLTNQVQIDGKKGKIEVSLNKLREYQEKAENRKLGYYDAFKLQAEEDDFLANVHRLVLAGFWDEIIEMLRRDELPDEFESRKEWIELGTNFRRLVEPLDIGNYYRHLKNEDTGHYLPYGRPKRYRFTQKWLEHAEKKPCGESCFWAEVEALSIETKGPGSFQETKMKVEELAKNVREWIKTKALSEDVFLENSTFAKWWETLHTEYKSGPESSEIAKFIKG